MLYAKYIKRGLDLLAAAALLIILLPLLVLVWIAVRLCLGSPVLYFSERAGQGGRPFLLAKFRSMTDAKGPDGCLLPDEARLTPCGRFLRRTSLDELPQLVSVLTGSMSMIGPRPLPLRYLSRYSPRQARRLEVLPGLTGWAQIHGRNSLDWPTRLELDVQYVDMLGRWFAPALDLWIALATIGQLAWQAVTGRGIAAPGSATMTEFE
jgi:sugar transferase EpsL